MLHIVCVGGHPLDERPFAFFAGSDVWQPFAANDEHTKQVSSTRVEDNVEALNVLEPFNQVLFNSRPVEEVDVPEF
jgi:hypothetical protein